MKFKLIAEVEGDIHLKENCEIEFDNILYEFISNTSGQLKKIAVSIQIPLERIRDVVPQFGARKNGVPVSIVDGPDSSIWELLVHHLQALESNISFSTHGALKYIGWNNPKEEFIPESPEEKSLLDISAFSVSHGKPNPVLIKEEDLASIISTASCYEALIIPKAFLREASVAYSRGQYIQSFYNSFFILEDFYAQGKTRKVDFVKNLTISAEFTQAGEATLKLFQKKEPSKYLNLVSLFKEVQCEPTISDLPEALFLQRGGLHHYYSKSPKNRGTPFNQREYQSLALFAMTLASMAIALRIVSINQNVEDND